MDEGQEVCINCNHPEYPKHGEFIAGDFYCGECVADLREE